MNRFRFFSKSLTLFVLLVALTVTSFSCDSVRNNEDTTVSASGSSTPDPALTAPEPNETTDENGNEKTADVAAETSSAVAGSAGLEYRDNGDGTCKIAGIGKCTDTDIVIPSQIGGLTVTAIMSSAFRECKTLESVVIPDSVIKLGSGAFSDCSSLRSVILPGNIGIIEKNTFKNCVSLTHVEIPSGIIIIWTDAFYGCTGLKSVSLPDTLRMLSGFRNCTGLTEVIIPNRRVTSLIARAFEGCTGLTGITIPDSVEVIADYAFSGCNFTSIVIPDSVISFGENVFAHSAFTEIVLPDGIQACQAPLIEDLPLTEITVPGKLIKYYSGTFQLKSLFLNCKNLKTIYTDLTVAEMNEIFLNCSWLIDRCGFSADPGSDTKGRFTGTIKCSDGEIIWDTPSQE